MYTKDKRISTHRLPRKLLGQNYMVNKHVLRKIAGFVLRDAPAGAVLEIGPGRGALTRLLINVADPLVCVELDINNYDFLVEKFSGNANVHFIRGDILKQDLSKLASDFGTDSFTVAGNIPYRITAPLLFHLISQRALIRRVILTLQREVADRLTAKAGSRANGLLSLTFGLYAQTAFLMGIPPKAFRPKPKVNSAVVEITFTGQYLEMLHDVKVYKKVTRCAFGQKRKMIKNSLQNFFREAGLIDNQIIEVLKSAGIAPESRAGTVPINDYITLSNIIGDRIVSLNRKKT